MVMFIHNRLTSTLIEDLELNAVNLFVFCVFFKKLDHTIPFSVVQRLLVFYGRFLIFFLQEGEFSFCTGF